MLFQSRSTSANNNIITELMSVILSFFFWPLCCLSFFWLPLWYLQTLRTLSGKPCIFFFELINTDSLKQQQSIIEEIWLRTLLQTYYLYSQDNSFFIMQFVIEDTVTSHVFVITVLISRLAVEIISTMTRS